MAIEVLLAPLGATAVTVIDGLTIHVGSAGDGTANQVGGGKVALACEYATGGLVNAASNTDFAANEAAEYTPDFYGVWDGAEFIREVAIAVEDRIAVPTSSFFRFVAGRLVLTLSDIT